MLAYVHAQSSDKITCMGCHVPTMSEQISEGMAWLTGDYYIAGKNANGDVVMEASTMADLTEARGVDELQFCVNDACHASAPIPEGWLNMVKAQEMGVVAPVDR